MSLTLKKPNLGQPVLALRSFDASKTVFTAVFAATKTGINLKQQLSGKLFLQALSNTQTVIHRHCMPELVNFASLLNQSGWPNGIKKELIPVKIDAVKPAKSATWKGWSWIKDTYESYKYEYTVTLSIATKDLEHVIIPQLFNFIFVHGISPRYNFDINFHAVYVHEQSWSDFRFAQITDTHLSWRNEIIAEEILTRWQEPVIKKWQDGKISTVYPTGKFVNFNENLRTFIDYANYLHRQGKLDFILLTGDIVDYIEPVRRAGSNTWNNFDAFLDIITALPRFDKKLTGAELEVPIFTMLGNHDYRPEEYPLVAKYVLEFLGIPLYKSEQFSNFGLCEEEACLFETGQKDGITKYTAEAGLKHVLPINHPPDKYSALINPDPDFAIQLGKHRIICLDTAHDEGAVTGIWDYLVNHHESRNDFIAGSPDSSGLSQQQLSFIKSKAKGTKGRLMLALHAPWVNIHGNTPFHMLRESERTKLTTHQARGLLFKYLLQREFTTVQHEDLLTFLDKHILTKQQKHQGLVFVILSNLEFSQGSTLLLLFISSWLNKSQRNKLETDIYNNELKDKMSGNVTLEYLVSNLSPVQQQARFFYVVNILFTQSQKLKFVKHVIPNVVKPYQSKAIALNVLKTVLNTKQAGKTVTLLTQQDLLDQYMTQEWSYDVTPYFKRGARDPYLGRCVTDHGFAEFLKIVTQQIGPDRCADLILSGHTHRSIEYKVDLKGNKARYYHDYYIDNRIHGESPQQYWWNSDKYRNYPNAYWANLPGNCQDALACATNAKAWWSSHRPLFVQLLGLGPIPSKEPAGAALLVSFTSDVVSEMERVYLPTMKQQTTTPAQNQAWFYLTISRP